LRDQLGAYGYRLLDALADKDAPARAVTLPADGLGANPVGTVSLNKYWLHVARPS